MDNLKQSQAPETNNQIPPSNGSTRSKIIPLGLGILFVLITIVAYLLGTRQSQKVVSNQQNTVVPTTILSPTPDGTANWKTYINNSISFKYPPGWKFSDAKYPGLTSYSISSPDLRIEGGLAGGILTDGATIYDPIASKSLNVNSSPANAFNKEKNNITSTQDYSKNGIEGKIYKMKYTSASTLVFLTTYENRLVGLALETTQDNLSKFELTFNQILSTFKFTQQDESQYSIIEKSISPNGSYTLIHKSVADYQKIQVLDNSGKIVFDDIIEPNWNTMFSHMKRLGLLGSGQTGFKIKNWVSDQIFVLEIGLVDGQAFETHVDVKSGKIIDSTFKRIRESQPIGN